MTRINPIIFALLVGLLGAGLFYMFVYLEGKDRLSQIAIPTALIITVSWFMAQRVKTKPAHEQLKQRFAALGVMLVITAGYLFMDYKTFEKNFVDNCSRSASIFMCECLEENIGFKIWYLQLPDRPQVAMGKESLSALVRRITAQNREEIQAITRSCSR